MEKKNGVSTYKIVFTAVMAAIVCVITLFRFPLLGSKVHFANAMCLLSGLLFGPLFGGLAAGLGSALYDGLLGGYDIVNDLDGVLTEFDRIIGLDHLKAIHLNDSLNPLGSHKDRHARIGEGQIGLDALARVIRHPALKGKPFILETPNDDEGWTREIALLRERYSE